MTVYSATGSEQFNRFLDAKLHALGDEVQQAMGESFLALILAGGYGRGEGACVMRQGKESPYNDFDLFLVLKEALPLPEEVTLITKAYEEQLGIEVDIGKPLSVAAIRKLPHQLMWQDLLEAHRVITGDPRILLDNAPFQLKAPLPKVEALRLLLNRGSGLLQAIIQSHSLGVDAQHSLPDEDFIRRNREKCTLALGDSLLITHQRYAPPLHERTLALQKLGKEISWEGKKEILDLYARAAAFKTDPDSFSREQPSLTGLKGVARLWVGVLLHCERERTGKEWATASSYAHDHFIREKEQHTPKALLRNLVKNLKVGTPSLRYPREKLYAELALLLEDPRPESGGWRERADQFLKVWSQYN
ncbi:MAG: hypothetical protein RBR15_02195 [Sphaerochaeta sp.]|nr:hypothetical protein [Sphaerochaeta sp.]